MQPSVLREKFFLLFILDHLLPGLNLHSLICLYYSIYSIHYTLAVLTDRDSKMNETNGEKPKISLCFGKNSEKITILKYILRILNNKVLLRREKDFTRDLETWGKGNYPTLALSRPPDSQPSTQTHWKTNCNHMVKEHIPIPTPTTTPTGLQYNRLWDTDSI